MTRGACVHPVAHRATFPSKLAVDTLKHRARSGLPGERDAALHGLSQSALYAWRKGLQATVASPIPNTRLVAIAVQQHPSFARRLRSGHLLRFREGVVTEPVAALLRALEAP